MDNKKFVVAYIKVYNTGGNAKDVARVLDKSVSYVYSKANYLRHRGVNLPLLNRAEKDFTVDHLNDYISRSVK